MKLRKHFIIRHEGIANYCTYNDKSDLLKALFFGIGAAASGAVALGFFAYLLLELYRFYKADRANPHNDPDQPLLDNIELQVIPGR